MAQLIVSPEHQIQRLNKILNTTATLRERSLEELCKAPNAKSWNVLEVLEHLSISYALYRPKIEQAMAEISTAGSEAWEFKVRPWQRFVIQGQRPKGNKRPFKMKTLKRFEPLLAPSLLNQSKANEVFDRFIADHEHFKSQIVESRTKRIQHRPFASAIGPIVRFYLPEAFEFLLCHAERHFVQIDEILAAQS